MLVLKEARLGSSVPPLMYHLKYKGKVYIEGFLLHIERLLRLSMVKQWVCFTGPYEITRRGTFLLFVCDDLHV
jgi:hypothetical protein